jgi:hypothetical protein
MAASKLNANWSAVSHGLNTITRVTTAAFSRGGALMSFSADGDRYPTAIVNLMSKPTASVTTADVGLAFDGTKFPVGADAALSATLNDAKGASGGSVIFTLANAVLENVQGNGQHGQFASATLNFQAYSSDGTTSPLSIARA